MTSSYQRFTKNMGIIGTANVFIAAERIILLPILTKLLGAANYGIWIQLSVTLSLISPLALLGLPYTLVRFLSGEKDKKEIQEGFYSIFVLIFLVSLIAAFLLVVFSDSFANFLQAPPIFINILALIILFECLNLVLLAFLQAFQEIGKYAFFLISKALGEVGLVILSVFMGWGLLGAVLSLLVIRVLVFLPLFGLVFKRIGIKIPNFSRIQEYLRFGIPTVVSSVAYWMVTSSDRYLISFFLGVLSVGYYAPAYTIGNLLTLFIYPLTFMLPPVLSKLFEEKEIEKVKTYLRYSLKYFLMLTIPLAFGLTILSKQIIEIFSTREIALNSHFVTPFIVLSMVFYGVYIILVQILVLAKKTRIFGTIWLVAALLNFSLNLWLIPQFGIIAAAITTLLAYSFALILTWHYSFREFPFKIDWTFIIKSIFASALMALVIILVNPIGLFKTLAVIILGVIIYGVLILLLKGFDKKEIEFVKSFVKV